MPNNLTNYSENEVLKWLIGKTTSYVPSSTKLALLTALPSDDTGVTDAVEVTDGGYARANIIWNTPAGGQVSNSADIAFPIASANWGIIVGAQIWNFDGTVIIAYGPLTAPTTVNNGDTFKITTGSLILALD